MSGLFMLGLIAAWLFVGWLIYLIWGVLGFGAQDKLIWKTLHRIIGVGLFGVWFGVAFWAFAGKKMYYDAQVRGLCESDGGVTIYETVLLSSEKYSYYQKKNWILPNDKQLTKSDEYYIETKKLNLRMQDPRITRTVHRIIRRSDRKVLGQLVRYSRGGGDLPGLWHESSYLCPDPVKSSGFELSVFTKE